MAAFNQVTLIGNLTRDVQSKVLPSGSSVAELGLAVSDRRKNGDEWIDEVLFIDVSFFGRTAEIAAEYLSKGSPVFIVGKLKLDTWEKDGVKHYKHRVIGDKLQFLSSGSGGKKTEPASVAGDDVPGEDVPF